MSLTELLAGVGSAAAGYDIANDIRDVGEQAAGQMGALSGQLQDDVAFRGYGVTTGLGSSSVDPYGNMNVGVGPEAGLMNPGMGMYGSSQNMFNQAAGLAGTSNPAYAQAMAAQGGAMAGLGGQQANSLSASQQAMRNAMMGTGAREQEVYERAMAMQEPALQRAQAQQQAREYQMGRGGIRGSQFGGTAEDAAMARARAEASNQASFQAMGQAQNEMMNQGSLASQFGAMGQQAAGLQSNIGNTMGNLGFQQAQLGQAAGGMLSNIAAQQGNLGLQGYSQAFTPLQQQLNALQIGGQGADRFQSGQFTGANLAGQLGLGGLQTQVNAEKAASELYGSLFGAGMTAIGNSSFFDDLLPF